MTANEIAVYLQAKPGITYRLNPGNKSHLALIKGGLDQPGPQLQKTLGATTNAAAAKPGALTAAPTATSTGGLGDVNIISNFNEVDGPNEFTASGLSSVVDGTVTTTIKTMLIDVTKKTVLDTAIGTQMGQGTHFSVPVTASAPAGDSIMAAALITYVPNDSPSTVVSVVVTSSQAAIPTSTCMTAPNYCTQTNGQCNGGHSSACTNNLTSRPPISVCYFRGSAQTCDYWYNYSAHPTTYQFPVAGNAVFSKPIVSPAIGNMTATLENPILGGGCQIQLNTPLADSQWTVSGNTVTWNINPIKIADPNACFTNYSGWIITNFYFSADVQLQGATPSGQPLYGRVSFTSDSTQSGQPGIYIIPILDIQQGCFAQGTRIAVKNGEQAIETFKADPGETVLSEGKKLLPVTATSGGTEPQPMKRIKAGEFDVLATRQHPFMTQRGFVIAEDLSPGDTLMTIKGKRALSSLADEKFGGKVYNLRVGTKEQAEKGRELFYANGFLVGGAWTQHHHEKLKVLRKAKDPAFVKEHLPKEWLGDYALHLKTSRNSKKPAKGAKGR